VSTIKLRQAGFAPCIDTEQCIVEHLQAMQAQHYLPQQRTSWQAPAAADPA